MADQKPNCDSEIFLSNEEDYAEPGYGYVHLKCSLPSGHKGEHRMEDETGSFQKFCISWKDEPKAETKRRRQKELKDVGTAVMAAAYLCNIFNANDPDEFGLDGEEGDVPGPVLPETILKDFTSFRKLYDWCKDNCFEESPETDEERHDDECLHKAMDVLDEYFRGQRC